MKILGEGLDNFLDGLAPWAKALSAIAERARSGQSARFGASASAEFK
jgi:hypothetical protein